ncbi:MAG: response regulator [bacterium]|nr:response regulator [bacterium]
MAGERILVVEDEAVVARDLEQTLVRLGYEVVGVAQFAAEAVGKAAETRPDLVLMDISLQGDKDGIQAAEVIGTRFGTPVVFLTAHTDKATVARAQSAKPAGYIVKPFNREKLHETIAAALGVEVIHADEKTKAKASILLVDDSNHTQAISLSLLGKQYRVRIATTWGRAKQMLKETKVDLIVANIDQADAGRGQTLRTLRREEQLKVPAIVMADAISAQDLQLLKGENVAAFIVFTEGYETKLAREVEKLLQ